MMMMKTAGGPSWVSPIDAGARRKPTPRWVWVAVGASILAHGAVGVVLYQQRFEIAVPTPIPEPRGVRIEFERPKPPPPVALDDPAPPAPTPPLHVPDRVLPTDQPLYAIPAEDPVPVPGPAINLSHPVDETATGVAATPAPAPAAPSVITQPSWLRKPSGDQLLNAYPARALRADVPGSATLRCAVRLDGSLTGCAVLSETPGGYGFGRAALGLSRHFRMNPGAVDGHSIDGARVDVGVRFTLPEN